VIISIFFTLVHTTNPVHEFIQLTLLSSTGNGELWFYECLDPADISSNEKEEESCSSTFTQGKRIQLLQLLVLTPVQANPTSSDVAGPTMSLRDAGRKF
jgi:hypothetical protein